MTKTTNYNLNQWDAADPIRREDFNADNAALDAAMKTISSQVTRIAYGTYTGTGTYGADNPNSLTFDFEPSFVVVYALNTHSWDTTSFSLNLNGIGFFRRSSNVAYVIAENTRYKFPVIWDGNTLSWYNPNPKYSNGAHQLNWYDYTNLYIAVK